MYSVTILCSFLKVKRLLKIVHAKTSEKRVRVDEETASFLEKSDKLQEFKMEQFDQHQVLIDPELVDPCNIWIVCEESKMNNAEQELTRLTDEMKIASCTFIPMDTMKVRFLKEHCWSRIKEKEKSCEAEGVAVLEIDSGSLEVKGTQAGRKEMITFLSDLAEQINCKVRIPQRIF
jgi:activator of 2-hydroxyglutaryl-CoA dehydratase